MEVIFFMDVIFNRFGSLNGHEYNIPYAPTFLGHADDEFQRADEVLFKLTN